MKKQIISMLLAAALVVTGSAPYASAAGTVTSNGEGTVYTPKDIIDVIVPTTFKIAFNPLGVTVTKDDYSGNSQILSGTYAIQNRSTVPVSIAAAFTVTGSTQAGAATAADVAKDNAATTKPTAAKFSLDLVTTATGTVQALADLTTPPAKADGSTDTVRSDKDTLDKYVTGVKITKASTAPISLTTKAGATSSTTVNFMFNAGPYVATYDKEKDLVYYKANERGTWDTVAFKFSGTTSTYADLWAKVTTAPTVKATYTLTESTPTAYASTPFSPTSKNVTLKTGEADVTVTNGVANKDVTFAAKPTLTMDKDDPTKVAATQKITLLSLLPGAKPDAVTHQVAQFGTYTADDETGTYTYKVDGAYVKANLDPGFYSVTVGKQLFTIEVK